MPDEIRKLTGVSIRNFCGINVYRHTKDSKKKSRWFLLAATWGFVGLMMLGYLVALCVGLIKSGLSDILPEYLFAISAICIFMFSLFRTGNVIFETHTYEMQISMPVRKSSIVISRFLTMYLSDVLLSFLIMVTGMAVYGAFNHPGVMFYIYGILGTVLLPLIPLTLTTALGAVFTAIGSRMKHKSLVSSFFTIVFVLAIVAGNLSLTSNPEMMNAAAMTNLAESVSTQIGKMYPPALWINKSMINGDFLSFLILFAVSVALFVVMTALVGKFFTAICSALKSTSAKNNYKYENQKSHSIINALFKRELRRYFASGIYVSNTIVGYIFMATASVALFFVGSEKIEATLGISGVSGNALPFVLGGLSAIMSTTACSVSLEGKQFWIAKTLPITAKNVFDSKIAVNLAVTAPFYIIAVIFGIAAVKPDIFGAIMIIVIPALYIIFSAVAGITVNLAVPNLNWTNETQIVKQSASTFIAMLVGFISFVPPVAIIISSKSVSYKTVFLVTAAVLSVLTIVLYNHNNKKSLLSIN